MPAAATTGRMMSAILLSSLPFSGDPPVTAWRGFGA